MNVTKTATMSWEEAPDTITPEIYSCIRGCSVKTARNIFNKKNFPRITETSKQLADKTAVQLYDMGIIPKENPKQSVEYLILLELKKINVKVRENE